MNNNVLGGILIIVGLMAVIGTLFPIYLYESSRSWQVVDGSITSTKVLGMIMRFRRCISYTYRVGTKDFTNTQIIPRDPWVDELKVGSKVPLRYKDDEPKFVLIDHLQVWQDTLLAALNGVWIVAGFMLRRRK